MPLPLSPWLIACLSRELKADRPTAVVIDDSAIVLFRDEMGRAVALDDRCAHRNAPLSQGCVKSGTLQCSYHGWSYSASGQVVSIPALAAMNGTNLPSVRTYPCVEREGFVWIKWDAESTLIEPPDFPFFKARGWQSFLMQTRFAAPMDACLENFLDCPHATYLHRYWFRSPTEKRVRASIETLDDGVMATFSEEPREKSAVWWFLAPRRAEMRHTDRFIAPRTSRVDYEFSNGLHYVITSSCTPISATETQVYTVIAFRYKYWGALVRLFFEPLARKIIRQDADMLAAQYANIARFGGASFVSTSADLLGRHIAAWQKAIKRGEPMPAAGNRYDVDILL